MPHWLASERREQASDFVTRFDPRFWTVNFPRPAMAAVTTTTAPDALRVDAVFYREGDLVGLIWEAADAHDHPLLVACADQTVTLDAVLADGAFAGGRLRWFGGANGGLEGWIAANTAATVTLRAAPAFAVEADVLVELIEGCDKSLATCAGRFGNAANFRGEPYLPGIDLLTRYPGA